jgi:hypothetical protein
MGQVKVNTQAKCLSIPQWFFFSRKIPLENITEKKTEIIPQGGQNMYRLTLKGNFGEQTVNFDNYEGYAKFIYDYEKALMAG